MGLVMGRLFQNNDFPADAAALHRPATFRRLLSSATAAAQFGQRVDTIRSAMLAAANLLTTTSAAADSVQLTTPLAHVLSYFVLQSTRAYELDLGITQRLDEITSTPGTGVPLRLSAAHITALPSPLLVEWRELMQAHVRQVVRENAEIKHMLLPLVADGAAKAVAPTESDTPFASSLSTFLLTPARKLLLSTLLESDVALSRGR